MLCTPMNNNQTPQLPKFTTRTDICWVICPQVTSHLISRFISYVIYSACHIKPKTIFMKFTRNKHQYAVNQSAKYHSNPMSASCSFFCLNKIDRYFLIWQLLMRPFDEILPKVGISVPVSLISHLPWHHHLTPSEVDVRAEMTQMRTFHLP